ncbi:cbb3-type cytochrome oxidase assembly protein CcoS [Candidimonas nitroreducens]|uniref:Cbb3-type cytochrome oxidase assembly protein CcoS n=1 Tax=Candidimonas nitroreducens TaxID=683354 RepID=A0A225M9V0_9BURK|nr:cbb3-type cytochrome oxidase assembly protein CcoS [Candidimonas nitroreducens]OWT57512.1 cbb3-type cytochrome oxidase assembly protein CcoS [Candidimonas nitroreducens]
MNSLLILIPITLLIVLLAAAIFFWAVNHQQFEDLDSPGFVPLLDEPLRDEPLPDAAGSRASDGFCFVPPDGSLPDETQLNEPLRDELPQGGAASRIRQ